MTAICIPLKYTVKILTKTIYQITLKERNLKKIDTFDNNNYYHYHVLLN